MTPAAEAALPSVTRRLRPPAWLVGATGLLALGCLSLAVAETNLWMHYVIDAGESISLAGLGFILVSGLYLFTRSRLRVSLPLVVPWLLFPVITQGDQLIDNLPINWMRVIVHVLLGALFLMPAAVVVLALRYLVEPAPAGAARQGKRWIRIVPGLGLIAAGRSREGTAILTAMLLVLESWVAVRFLGELMVVTLIVMIGAVLVYGFSATGRREPVGHRSERFALVLLLGGVALSAGLFFGFKNRPGAYQGSPSYFMDPDASEGFVLDRIPVPATGNVVPSNPDVVRAALTRYAQAFDRLVAGYYILDRNYNYDFHNRLFLRNTPLLAGYRAAGLQKVREAEEMRWEADRILASGGTFAIDTSIGALLHDVRDYAAFTFDRAPVLERMSASFEQTEAGLQHATHLYEGEGKVLGVTLADLLVKHQAALSLPQLAPLTSEFVTISRAVHGVYANRIVGF